MQYSPKLKRVMEQIKKLLKDNDIAGVVVLHTPGHCEYLQEITPNYSCAEIMPQNNGIIIKGKLLHYGGDAAKRDKKLSETANMLSLLSITTMQIGLNLGEVSAQADKVWNIEHGGGGHTSHNQQNN